MRRPFPAYDGDEPYAFVCYAHDDAARVYPELVRLRDAGYRIWYDEGISAGSEWTHAIAEHLDRCTLFLFFVSPRSVASRHCARELVYALDQSCDVLAVHMEPTELPPSLKLSLGDRQGILRSELTADDYRRKLDAALTIALGGAQSRQPSTVLQERSGRAPLRRRAIGVAVAVLALAGGSAVFLLPQLRSADREPTATTEARKRQRIAIEPFQYPLEDDQLAEYARLLRSEMVDRLSRERGTYMDIVTSAEDADVFARAELNRLGAGVRLSFGILAPGDGNDAHQERLLWLRTLELPSEPEPAVLAARSHQLGTVLAHVALLIPQASAASDSELAIREFIAGWLEIRQISLGLGGDWQVARLHLERAAEEDPGFSRPLSELANLYLQRMGGTLRYDEAVGPAHKYVRQALAFGNEAIVLLAWVNLLLDLDYDAANTNFEYRRRNTASGDLQFARGLTRLLQGRLDEAVTHYDTALRVGAGSAAAQVHFQRALALRASGRSEQTLDAAEQAVVHTAGTGADAHLGALVLLIRARLDRGEVDAAQKTFESAWRLYGERYPERFVGVLVELGEPKRARSLLDEADRRWARGETFSLADGVLACFRLGDLDCGFEWLDRAIEDRQIFMWPIVRRWPELDPLREHPRFVAALARMAEIEALGTPTASVAYP